MSAPRFTPTQTPGPYVSLALLRDVGEWAEPDGAPAVRLVGRVTDGDGRGVEDAVLEVWHGGEEVCGPGAFRRVPTDANGDYDVAVAAPTASHGAAPHLAILLHAGGLSRHLLTRAYLPGDPGNRDDPVLTSVEPDRRSTLVATAEGDHLRFDIHLQGVGETVFFDV